MKVKFTMPQNSGLRADFNTDEYHTIATKAELNAEIEARIEGDSNLQSEITRVENEIPDISGLATKTELQAVENEIPDISNLATKTELQEVENEIPTKISQLTNDSGYITDVTWGDVANKPNFATVATSGSYNDLSNKPVIPTVNNPTITFTQGGTTKGTITLNQSANQTIAFDAGGGGGAVDSVNGQTGVVVLTASDVGALPNTTTIPTKTSDLTNDSGYVNQTDLQSALDEKQDVLTAGTDLEIVTTAGGDSTVTGTDTVELTNAVKNGLNSLTVSGATVQRTLPLGYTRVEYIASDGTDAYIDTGIIFNTFDYSVEIDVKFNGSLSSATPAMAWGFMGLSSNLPRWGFGGYQSKWLGSLNTTTPEGTTDNLRHTVVLEASKVNNISRYSGTLDGEELYPLTSATSPERYTSNDLSSYLFARNNNNVAGNFADCQIYGFKVRKAGVLVKNYIPCINPSNAVGFYDTVNNTFIGATAGTLTAGEEYESINPTPETPINIVCNNGIIKFNSQGQLYTDGDIEKITLDTTGNYVTAEYLLRINNKIDEQNILTGEITRDVDFKVLDGTEEWVISNVGDNPFFRLNNTVVYSGNLTSGFYCTHFETVSVSGTNTLQGIRIYSNSIFLRYDSLFTATSSNVSAFKSWLSAQYANGTPVILVFPKETTSTTTVTPQTLLISRGDNNLEITEASLTNLSISANYNYAKTTTINFTNASGYQTTSNLVTSVSSSSTDSQYPSAKLFYDTCGDIETALNTIRGV